MDIVDDQRDATRRALVARFVDETQAAIARRRPMPGIAAVLTSRLTVGAAFVVRCTWSRRSRAVVSASPTQRTPPNAGAAAASLARAIVDADVPSNKAQALSVAPLLCQQQPQQGGDGSIDGILIQYTPPHGNSNTTNGDHSAAQDASMRRALFAVVNWYLDGAHRHHGVGSTREYRDAIIAADAAQ